MSEKIKEKTFVVNFQELLLSSFVYDPPILNRIKIKVSRCNTSENIKLKTHDFVIFFQTPSLFAFDYFFLSLVEETICVADTIFTPPY